MFPVLPFRRTSSESSTRVSGFSGHSEVDSRSHRQSLYDIDKELLDYGVSFVDWRRPNVVYAPKSPPGLPSLPSPLLDRVFKYRLIDLEDAVVTNLSPEYGHKVHQEMIDELLRQMVNRWC